MDISSHMKLLKMIKADESTKNLKPNPILNNWNLSHSNLNQFEFYEKLKIELINNLNIQIENSSFNLGLNSDSYDFLNSLDLLEMRLKFSMQNLEDISNLNQLKYRQIISLTDILNNTSGNENINVNANDSIISADNNINNNNKNLQNDKLLYVFKTINELEKSLRPTFEIIEKIKIILKMKQNIIDIENKIRQNLENSISAINKMKIESSNFLPDVVNLNASLNKNLQKFEKGGIGNLNNSILKNNNTYYEDEIKYMNLEKAKINIIKQNIRANSSKYKLPKEINFTQTNNNNSNNNNNNANNNSNINNNNNININSNINSNYSINYNTNIKPNRGKLNNKLNKEKNDNKNEKNDKLNEKNIKRNSNSVEKNPKKSRNLIEELKITELSDEKYDTYRTMEMRQKTENENAISVQYNSLINNDSNYIKILQMLKDSFSKGEFLNDPIIQNENFSLRLISLINFNAFSFIQFNKKKTNITLDYFREGIIGRNLITLENSKEILNLNLKLENSKIKKIGQPHKIIEDFINYLLPLYIFSTKKDSIFEKILNYLYINVKKYLHNFFSIPKNYIILQSENQSFTIMQNLVEILYRKFPILKNSSEINNDNNNINNNEKPMAIITEYEDFENSDLKILENIGFEIKSLGQTSKGDWDNWENNLTDILKKNKNRTFIILCISAFCNNTGFNSPLEEIGDFIYDYKFNNPEIKEKFIFIVSNASAISHKKIDVERLAIDALLISTTSLLGGFSSSDIIIFNKNLYKEPQNFTQIQANIQSHNDSKFLFAEKTQKIFAFIRSASCIQLLDRIGFDFIDEKENEIANKFLNSVKTLNEKWSFDNKKNSVEIYEDIFLNMGKSEDKKQKQNEKEKEKRIAVFVLNLIDDCKNRISHELIYRILLDLFGIHVEKGLDKNEKFGIDFLPKNIEYDENKGKLNMNINPLNIEEENKYLKIKSSKIGWIKFKLDFYNTDEDINYLIKTFKIISENILIFYNNFYSKESDMQYVFKSEAFEDIVRKIENNGNLQDNIFVSTTKTENINNKIKSEYEEIMQFDIFNNFMIKECNESDRGNYMNKRFELIDKIIKYYQKHSIN
jgi:selenocysteine lyase/cysteine desulfurase